MGANQPVIMGCQYISGHALDLARHGCFFALANARLSGGCGGLRLGAVSNTYVPPDIARLPTVLRTALTVRGRTRLPLLAATAFCMHDDRVSRAVPGFAYFRHTLGCVMGAIAPRDKPPGRAPVCCVCVSLRFRFGPP